MAGRRISRDAAATAIATRLLDDANIDDLHIDMTIGESNGVRVVVSFVIPDVDVEIEKDRQQERKAQERAARAKETK